MKGEEGGPLDSRMNLVTAITYSCRDYCILSLHITIHKDAQSYRTSWRGNINGVLKEWAP